MLLALLSRQIRNLDNFYVKKSMLKSEKTNFRPNKKIFVKMLKIIYYSI